MLAMPDEVLGRPGVFDKVLAHAETENPFPAPSVRTWCRCSRRRQAHGGSLGVGEWRRAGGKTARPRSCRYDVDDGRGFTVDPAAIAIAAVKVLGPFFKRLAEKVTDAATERLAEAVAAKLPAGTYAGAVLQGVEEEPDDPDRQQALRAALVTAMKEDPGFAESLEGLLEEIPEGRQIMIQATDSGAVAGGNFTQTGTNVAGRDLTIGNPPGEPPRGKVQEWQKRTLPTFRCPQRTVASTRLDRSPSRGRTSPGGIWPPSRRRRARSSRIKRSTTSGPMSIAGTGTGLSPSTCRNSRASVNRVWNWKPLSRTRSRFAKPWRIVPASSC